MHFYQTERTGLFIDGANLYSTVKALGFDIDFKRLLALFSQRARLLRATYFTAVPDDEEFSSARSLTDWLQYNGFTLVTKPVKKFTNVAGHRKLKGNTDVELAVEAMRLSPELDHIVLFSGDGDFRSLVVALQERGKRVTVISSLITRPPMIADELRRQADQFVELAELRPIIGRDEPAAGANTS